jgi:hypothetical protein
MLKILNFKISRPAFGWEPDPPSSTDHPFDKSLLNVPAGYGAVDNTKYYKPISDQLSLPSCTANAAADFWEASLIYQLVKGGVSLQNAKSAIPDLSRLFLWYYGRLYMDPPRNGDKTSGCYNRLIMEVIARLGVPSESLWPYSMSQACVRPSITSQREAFHRRSKAFHKIVRDKNLVTNIVRALHQTPGVVFGTSLGNEFFDHKGGKVLGVPTRTAGRHAMVIVGHDPSKNAFKVRNSWSPAWGEAGYCWMSSDYITWPETRSFWTAEVAP